MEVTLHRYSEAIFKSASWLHTALSHNTDTHTRVFADFFFCVSSSGVTDVRGPKIFSAQIFCSHGCSQVDRCVFVFQHPWQAAGR